MLNSEDIILTPVVVSEEDIIIDDISIEEDISSTVRIGVDDISIEEDISSTVRIGVDGITFTPHINENSAEETILSFTNDGNRPNPPSINIKGTTGLDAFQLWLIAHPNGTYEEFEAYYKGAKGDTGESGVYVGPTEPVDPKIKLWITPDGSDYDFMKEAAQTAITAAQLADDKAILAAQQAESAYSAAQLANDATSAAMNFIEEHEEDFVGFNLRISTAEEKINSLLEEPDAIQQFPSYLNFPNLGKPNVLYIDTEENESYRWDNNNLKYYKINEIETINGGN